MRVVLDTNVIVSAALTADGACARVIDMLIEGLFAMCADDRILGEYDAVLRRPELGFEPASVDALLDLIRRVAVPVGAPPLNVALPDPDDLPFLEVAAASDALLVTGNERHYPRQARAGVRGIRPRELVDLIRRSE